MIITPKVEPDLSAMSQNQKSIAPKSGNFNRGSAPVSADAVSSSTSNGRPICRRRIAFHPTLGYPIPPTIPPKVARRNARERNRVKQVNCGFEMLRSHIPSASKAKKMSKVDTLRHAVEYIQNLQRMVDEQHMHQHHMHNEGMPPSTQLPQSLHLNNPEAPLTPTPSSRASSVPSPMTPHLPQLHHPHHQFILPDAPTYPSPLTPKTPSTPMSADFMVNSHYTAGSNDSGYDTNSFFSNSSNLMSPVSTCHRPVHHSGHHHQMEMVSPSDPLRGQQHLSNSPVSPPVYPSRPQTYTDMEVPHPYYTNYSNIIAENPEEEELLDAIAKWQEQDDE